ncbi:hypothetical protein [Sinomonas cyclohexanicum]|nr:hypothetical protein [Corynebacterium cyclohexanicum]
MQRRRDPWRRRSFRVFSIQQPLGALVAELNAFDPAAITGYPSILELLSEEKAAGRLRVSPVLVELAGESIDQASHARIEAGLGGSLHEAYAASEFLIMAVDCDRGWLHVNSDWVVLEPVQADMSPTPSGEPSHSVLLTNLANRVQPLIRYDLGDSVVARRDPCECGSPFPAIRVHGRCDDVLHLRTDDGRTVSVLPLAVASILDETPGVRNSQLVQTGPVSLELRLELKQGAGEGTAVSALENLRVFLADQGLPNVGVALSPAAPERTPRSGKYRQVVALPRTAAQ